MLLNKTAAADRVELSKSTPAQEEDFPAIRLYALGENVDLFDVSTKRYVRTLNISVECYAMGDTPDDLDLRLEEMGEIVETLFDRDDSLGGLVDSINFTGCDYQVEPIATAPLGVLILKYVVKFYTYAQRLEGGCLDAFKGADIEWAVGHNNEPTDNIIDATDTVDVPYI